MNQANIPDAECVGYDPRGVPRVYGRGPTPDTAQLEAMQEGLTYVCEKPATGPLSAWTFTLLGKR